MASGPENQAEGATPAGVRPSPQGDGNGRRAPGGRPGIDASSPYSAAPVRHRAGYLRDLVIELVMRDLNLRFKRSFLGIAWSLVTPLFQLLVLRFIFTVVLPLGIPNFTAFLFIGILVWSWFQGSLDQAAGSIVESRELVRLAGFPVAILPAVTVAANLMQFIFALPILAVFLWLGGDVPLTAAPLFLPLLLAVQFVFTLSIAYLVAALYVTFRDVKHLLSIGLMLGFYLTPVFYELKQAPEKYALFYQLNPMAQLIGAYRDIFLHARPPAFLPLAGLTAVSIAVLALTYGLFSRASSNFVDEL